MNNRILRCPQCKGPIIRVTQGPYSMLNADQFDSVKAGDYYCVQCPGNGRGKNRLCYWWESELEPQHEQVETVWGTVDIGGEG